eukprot:gene31072-6198_t
MHAAAGGVVPDEAALLADVDDFVTSLFQDTEASASGVSPSTDPPPAAPSPNPSPASAHEPWGTPPKPPSRPTSARAGSASSASKSKKKAKPAWALTGDDADKIDEEEMNDLLDFTEGLDFDGFVAQGLDFDGFVAQLDDPELQQTLKALDATDPSRIGMDEDEDKE